MTIGTSFPEYIFIRSCVFLLHCAVPILILLCIVILSTPHSSNAFTHLVELLAIVETGFYILVYLPRRYALQRAAVHPELLPREERRRLFALSQGSIRDAEGYLKRWFHEAPLSEIRRENVKEFFCWAFLSKAAWGPQDDEELDEYADGIEELLGRKLKPGRGYAVPLRLTLDPINMQHRPLMWYTIVALVDTMTYCYMIFYRFQFYRLPLARILSVFPFRLITLTTSHVSPSPTLSYWHRPHTSRTRLPLVFIHGIGIGLHPYVNFLAAINDNSAGTDGDIGILAIELMPISFRITGAIQSKDDLVAEIVSILNAHGFSKFVLMGHSYGTVVSTHLIHSPLTKSRISSVILADPVCFLLHLPDVAYNFTRRQPRRANEWQLYYIACTDMCVAHTLARHFFWMENALWREDVVGRNVTVTLGGQDLIVNTRAVGRYLSDDSPEGGRWSSAWRDGEEEVREVGRGEEWMGRPWSGEGLDVLWYEGLDHAQVFARRSDYGKLVDVVRSYCADV